ncbi:MAG: acyltransferase [Sphaerospermopsis sp. SIO1G1]|nr:acyltransferase [Sphaerospermopsis sp. SIO1G1]
MQYRLIAGSIFSYFYNHILTNFPSRQLRLAYLKVYLSQVGEGTSIQMKCRFLNGRKVYLGDRNVVNFGCLFDGRHYQIKTGTDVSIGPEATILTLGHDPQSPEFADKGGDVIIEDKVWIAYRAIILPGVKIGEGAVVGAGAVVTKDIEPYTIVAGNPARFVKKRNVDLKYSLNYQPWLI